MQAWTDEPDSYVVSLDVEDTQQKHDLLVWVALPAAQEHEVFDKVRFLDTAPFWRLEQLQESLRVPLIVIF